MYSGHGRLCVCVSLAAFPHYCTDPDVIWREWQGVPSSCALLGGFAIGGGRISLLRQRSAEREMSASACTHSMPGVEVISRIRRPLRPASVFSM